MHPVSTTFPATESRFLPSVPIGFAIGDREPLVFALRRVAVEQCDLALHALAEGPTDAAVHEVRKSSKRLRAMLRLVRREIGHDRYSIENSVLRDAARVLSPLRDAHVHAVSLDLLRDRFSGHLDPAAFAELSDRLHQRRILVHAAALESGEWRKVVYSLRSARARYAAWPVDPESAAAHGMAVVRHRFRSVADGLARTYGRGRQEMGEALRRPTADNFHAWRKRAKYLRHQLELLTPIFPDLVGGHAIALARLGELLGEEHDLAELLRLLAARPELCSDPLERSLLVAIVQHRRVELQSAASSLGRRVYAEPAARFLQRAAEYWEEWDAPVPVGVNRPSLERDEHDDGFDRQHLGGGGHR
ncbi:MAG TPA: CHAD domain-containing protein [Acidimicrobiia bacterium]|nr:CHAD domain-containing protein [Acidimicrobiia bacterium]